MTFQVVNGTWEDGTSAAKVTYVTLMKDGKWDMNGSAYLTAPTGMKPDAGYGGTDGTQGGWDTTPPATVSGTDDVTYTYTFAKSTTPIVPGNVLYVVEHYKANDDGTYPVSATETERFSGAIGAEVTATPKVYEGYCLDPALSNTTGTLTKIEKPEDIVTLKLYYAVDNQIVFLFFAYSFLGWVGEAPGQTEARKLNRSIICRNMMRPLTNGSRSAPRRL